MIDIKSYVLRIPEWAVPQWWRVAYKIPPPLDAKMSELIQIAPDSRFQQVVTGYLKLILEENKMPPADIAPTMLNLANDLVDGREIIIRTGDYISIQNHIRTLR